MASTSSPTGLRRTVISAREGKVLKYTGINKHNNTHIYFSTPKRCRDCSQKSRCTRGKYRTIAIHTCEPARERAHRPSPDIRVCYLATGSACILLLIKSAGKLALVLSSSHLGVLGFAFEILLR